MDEHLQLNEVTSTTSYVGTYNREELNRPCVLNKKQVPRSLLLTETTQACKSIAPEVQTADGRSFAPKSFCSTDDNKAVPIELKRLSNSDGYCAFKNMPDRREQRKIQALYSRLERAERTAASSVHRVDMKYAEASSHRQESASHVRCCVFKFKKKVFALNQTAKQKKAAAILQSYRSYVTPRIRFVNRRSSRFTVPASSYSFGFEIDPIVAASFDSYGKPTVDHVGRSSLHVAMGTTDEKTLNFVIQMYKRNNNLSNRDNSNLTALHIACTTGNLKAAQLLLVAGASPNDFGGESASTSLHEAVLRANYPMVELLLDFGGDIEAKDKHGRTTLDLYTSNQVHSLLTKISRSVFSSSHYTSKPIVSNNRLPTVFVLQAIPTYEIFQIKQYVLQSDICCFLSITKDEFERRYRSNIVCLTISNSTLANLIINPLLKNSFEGTAIMGEKSTIIELDEFVRSIFMGFNVTILDGAEAAYFSESESESRDTDKMSSRTSVNGEEQQIRIDDIREVQNSISKSGPSNKIEIAPSVSCKRSKQWNKVDAVTSFLQSLTSSKSTSKPAECYQFREKQPEVDLDAAISDPILKSESGRKRKTQPLRLYEKPELITGGKANFVSDASSPESEHSRTQIEQTPTSSVLACAVADLAVSGESAPNVNQSSPNVSGLPDQHAILPSVLTTSQPTLEGRYCGITVHSAVTCGQGETIKDIKSSFINFKSCDYQTTCLCSDYDSHPGDIYLATGTAHCLEFSMLSIDCLLARQVTSQ